MTQPAETREWRLLGQMLVDDGVLTDDQLAKALSRQRRNPQRLGQILIAMKLLDEEVLLKYLGAQFRKEPITQQELTELDVDIVRVVPEAVARQYRIIAVERHGKKLVVATADPLNMLALDDLRRATGLEVDFKIGPGLAIQAAIDNTYRRAASTQQSHTIDEDLRRDLGMSLDLTTGADDPLDDQELRTLIGRAHV